MILVSGLGAVITVVLILVVWKQVVTSAFMLAQGQDPAFDMGDKYEMMHRRVWYVDVRGRHGEQVQNVLGERVIEFALTGPWLLGRTQEGWFAIQKKRQQVHYPIPKEEVERTTGLDLSRINMERNPWPYVVARPQAVAAKAAVTRFLWILVFALPAAVGFVPPLVRMVSKRRGKLSEGGDGDAARV